MRDLLDTNILSNITKPEPSASLLTWMAEQVDDDLFIASLTIAEIHRGILEKPAGKKRVRSKPGLEAKRARSHSSLVEFFHLTRRQLSCGER
ncbi:toxin (fragment) (plasmid) [Agrobacterium pusense]|uniref:Toxin n=1 Tax=Agrobacterium pusense TaxID=648995 RepID=U4Q549_9HYPH